jgi:hypothetical protein
VIVLAYGMPGSGKSTLLHDLVAAQFDVQRFFVNDHEAQWGPDGVHWRGRPPPIHMIYKGGQLPEPLPETGVFVFRNWEPRDVAQLATLKGWTTYVDDELDKSGRKQGFDTSPLRAIANEGRHLATERGEYTEVHILGACRRPQKLHNDLSELAQEVYVFRCQGTRTLRRLLEDNHIEDEDLEQVPSLPNFRCRHWPSGTYYDLEPVKPRFHRPA